MKQKDLHAAVAARLDISTQEAAAVVKACSESLIEALASGQDVRFGRLGKFRVRRRPARAVRHPQTGEVLTSPAEAVVAFLASDRVRSRVAESAADRTDGSSAE